MCIREPPSPSRQGNTGSPSIGSAQAVVTIGGNRSQVGYTLQVSEKVCMSVKTSLYNSSTVGALSVCYAPKCRARCVEEKLMVSRDVFRQRVNIFCAGHTI